MATSASGCTNLYKTTVTIDDVSVPHFTFANACENSDLIYTNGSTIASGGMTYAWSFGYGNTSALTDPTNAFTATGNYNTKLVVSSLNGCKDSITQSITVYPTPVANFVVPNGCENSLLNYNNTSSISNGSLTYQWTIPTFGTSNTINQSYTYTTAGFYDVELIAIS